MTISQVKMVFCGTSEFGAVILEKLIANSYLPVAVITAPDKPVGRKQVVTPPPVKVTAQNYKIPVIQPEKIADCRLPIEPELIVVASYGQILPQEILDLPKYGCFNVHPSLLPEYRGSSPIQTAILNGDKETGVTIILMDGRIDHGPILAQKNTVIGSNETAEQLHDRLAVLGGELLIDIIPDWIGGKIELQPQNEEKATYTKILTKEDGRIDWKKPAEFIDRQIRAFNPWPGAYAFLKKGKKEIRLKVLEAHLEKNKLIIKKVQPEGKKPMDFKDFLRGNPNFKTL